MMRRIAGAVPGRAWSIWRLPPRVMRRVLVVDAVFGVLLVATAKDLSFRVMDVVAFCAFTLLGWTAIRAARDLGAPGYRDGRGVRELLSCWTLPVVLLLPPFYAVILNVSLYCVVPRKGIPRQPHRDLFFAAALGISGFCASRVHTFLVPVDGHYRITALVGSPGTLAALCAAAGVYHLVNTVILRGAFHRVSSGAGREALALDATELCSGILVAVLWTANPLLMIVAAPPALLLQRGLVHSELLNAARMDGKTRLANPAHWQEVAERELARACRAGTPLSVLIVDIDHFKGVNDRYGHLAGDAVLVTVADALRGACRPHDLVGRFGGEEFVILLTDVDLAAATDAAERIRRRISSQVCRRAGLPPVAVTVSIGVATHDVTTHDGGPDGLEALLERADLALYRAKADGRNLVRVGSPVPMQRPA